MTSSVPFRPVAEAERSQSIKANAAAVDRALRKTFQYMHELFRQLNVVKPPCARAYDLLTVGKIDGLVQSDYRIEFRTSQRDNKEHYENLSITFKRTKPEQLTVKRDAYGHACEHRRRRALPSRIRSLRGLRD